MSLITASMSHTKSTLQLLSQTQYNTFSFWKKILQFVCSIILIILGIYSTSQTTLSILCIFIGCWMLTNTNMPANHRANKIIEAMHGKYPFTQYEFFQKSFCIIADRSRQDISYKKLIRIVEDHNYCYLYISRISAYMIDKSTLSSDIDTFKNLVSQGSGLQWTKPNNLLTFSFKSLIKNNRI